MTDTTGTRALFQADPETYRADGAWSDRAARIRAIYNVQTPPAMPAKVWRSPGDPAYDTLAQAASKGYADAIAACDRLGIAYQRPDVLKPDFGRLADVVPLRQRVVQLEAGDPNLRPTFPRAVAA